jgi:hypothetical protein
MDRPRPSPLRTFLTALLYGAAVMAAVSNTLAFVLGLGAGSTNPANLSLRLLGRGVNLYVHRRRGWPPFRA